MFDRHYQYVLGLSLIALNPTVTLAESSPTPMVTQTVSQGESLTVMRQSYQTFKLSLTKVVQSLDRLTAQKGQVDVQLLKQLNTDFQILVKSQTSLQQSFLNIPDYQTELQALNDSLNNLSQVIIPLEKGVNKESITTIQKYLNFFPKRKIENQYYGFYGKTTQEELEKFLSQEINIFETNIIQLQNKIALGEKVKPTVKPSLSSEQMISQDIQTLKSDIEELKLIQARQQFLLWIFLSGGVITGIIFWINRQTKPQLLETPSKTYRLTHNDLIAIEEDLYTLVAKELRQQFQTIETRLNELETIDEDGLTPEQREIFNQLPPIKTPFDELVNIYNQNPEVLASEITQVEVLETKVSLEETEGYVEGYFTIAQDGKYWIVDREEGSFLVPKAGLNLNEEGYKSLQSWFECYGDFIASNGHFKLLQPARVAVMETASQWELLHRGILQF